MKIEFVGIEMLKQVRKIEEDDEIVVFYQTDPDLVERFGFEPEKVGLKVFTIGYYPMWPGDLVNPTDDNDGKPYIFSILGTTTRWIEESRILWEIEKELDIDGTL